MSNRASFGLLQKCILGPLFRVNPEARSHARQIRRIGILPVRLLCVFILGALVTPGGRLVAQQEPSNEGSVPVPKLGRLLTSEEGGRGRFQMRADPVRQELIAKGLVEFAPREGAWPQPDSPWRWKQVELDEQGQTSERGLYLYVPIESQKSGVVLLTSTGHSELYWNGEPRCGNVYGNGYVQLPVFMRKGVNHLLMRAGRKPFQFRFANPPADLSLGTQDQTVPNLVVGEEIGAWGAMIVFNATEDVADNYQLKVSGQGLRDTVVDVPPIPPLTLRKVAYRIEGEAPVAAGAVDLRIQLQLPEGQVVHEASTKLSIVEPTQLRTVTFVSEIDGSVQYYGLRPALAQGAQDPLPAIVLTCHGAGVEGRGQAASYSSKDWFHIVAPTNRRPFGYDWEDFGRMDAMEVLKLAQEKLRHDPSRVYVTGHSMGGHGAWHLAVTYPDQFAAVGPSAGWISRGTYGRRRPPQGELSAVETLWNRSRSPADTMELVSNLKDLGIYMVHGSADDNVPAAQAKTMAEVLETFHQDWQLHQEPGKGHWWGNDYGDGGTACVDWPFLFDLFARRARPPRSTVRQLEFSTANPGISSRYRWLTIEAQQKHLQVSQAKLHIWPNRRKLQGETKNIARMTIDLSGMGSAENLTIDLDGQVMNEVPVPEHRRLHLERSDQWRVVDSWPLTDKGPHRYGGIKDELDHHLVLVYATGGPAEQRSWAYRKARLDAETFWYRGNASVDLIADRDFEASKYPDRTVVLYGHAESNLCWDSLLSESPVQVRAGRVQVGDREMRGDDLAAYFIRPRPGSEVASVVVVAGTGLAGMRSTYGDTFFGPATRFPDCLVLRAGKEVEPIAAGYFGLDWSVVEGEFAFASE